MRGGDDWAELGVVELRLAWWYLGGAGVSTTVSLFTKNSNLSNLSSCCVATVVCDEEILSSFFSETSDNNFCGVQVFRYCMALTVASGWKFLSGPSFLAAVS